MSVSIDIDHVVKKYGSNTVINGLSLSVKPGEFLLSWDRRAVVKPPCSA